MNPLRLALPSCAVGVLLSSLVLGLPQQASPRAPRTNEPPVCNISLPQSTTCQGELTIVFLDASGSYDPEGAPLSFLWTSGCPGVGFDDPTSATPLLLVDSSSSCELGCWVRLRLSDGKRSTFCRAFVQLAPAPPLTLDLDLDIKPGSCPNPIQVGSGGVVPVSLLGTQDFDVTAVDLTSLRLVRADGTASEALPISANFEDTGTPYVGDGCGCHELQGDGYLDLSLKFDKVELVDLLGLQLEPSGSFVTLRLAGTLLDGQAFRAEDCVRVQG